MKTHSQKSAFTLTEVMFAGAISLIVVGAAMALLVYGLRTTLLAASSSNNDVTQWGVASRLWVDAKIANGVTIYRNMTSAEIVSSNRRNDGEGGDFMLLSLSTVSGGVTSYEKLTGYYYDKATSEVRYFVYEVPSADQTQTLEQIVQNKLTTLQSSSRPLAEGITPVNSAIDSSDTSNREGIFTCRRRGVAAVLAFTISSGHKLNRTMQKKVVETSFFIR